MGSSPRLLLSSSLKSFFPVGSRSMLIALRDSSQVAAPDLSKLTTRRTLCMLEEGAFLGGLQEVSQACPGVCWFPLEKAELRR